MQEKHETLDFHRANICITQTDENRDSFCINQMRVTLPTSSSGQRIRNLVANEKIL